MNIYFIAGTLQKHHPATGPQWDHTPARIESMMASGVWHADSLEIAVQGFHDQCKETYPGFTVHEIQDHEFDFEWAKEVAPDQFRPKTTLVDQRGNRIL